MQMFIWKHQRKIIFLKCQNFKSGFSSFGKMKDFIQLAKTKTMIRARGFLSQVFKVFIRNRSYHVNNQLRFEKLFKLMSTFVQPGVKQPGHSLGFLD